MVTMIGDFAQTKVIRPRPDIWTGDPTNVEQTLYHRDKKGGGYVQLYVSQTYIHGFLLQFWSGFDINISKLEDMYVQLLRFSLKYRSMLIQKPKNTLTLDLHF